MKLNNLCLLKKNEADRTPFLLKELDSKNTKILSANAINILEILSEKEMYPKEIARVLGMNEQKVYYYVNNLKKAGLVDVVGEKTYGGLTARYFSATSDGAFVLWKKKDAEKTKTEGKENPLSVFSKNSFSNTIFVLGAPMHHGKQMAKAEDEKLAILIALFAGSFSKSCSVSLSNVKYDIDMTENDLKKNLIIIGGPAINKTTALINRHLAVKFLKKDDFYYALYSAISRKKYSDENCGFIEKIINPFNKYSAILVLGGRRSTGTEAAVFFLINKFKSFEAGNQYNKNIFSKIVKGFDEDNDGIVDKAEELE